jgi:hypothetical protein
VAFHLTCANDKPGGTETLAWTGCEIKGMLAKQCRSRRRAKAARWRASDCARRRPSGSLAEAGAEAERRSGRWREEEAEEATK